jgi:hypothetical protein
LNVPETKIGVICDVEEIVKDEEGSMGVEDVEAVSESGSEAASVCASSVSSSVGLRGCFSVVKCEVRDVLEDDEGFDEPRKNRNRQSLRPV